MYTPQYTHIQPELTLAKHKMHTVLYTTVSDLEVKSIWYSGTSLKTPLKKTKSKVVLKEAWISVMSSSLTWKY